ncbi:MAG: hypothetical protein ACOX1N_04345 [Candidatus Methanomethylophilaceae archaeon]
MTPEEVAEILRRHNGVVRVEVPDADFLRILKEDDMCVDTSFGMPIENKAMEDCLSCDFVLCVYVNLSFEKPENTIMMMRDSKGNVFGHSIPDSQIESYNGREDIIWLSYDFVLYPAVEAGEDMILVMLPQEYRGFSEQDGISEALVFYPAVTTDCIIKEKYGDPGDPSVATLLMGIKTG